MVDRDIFIWDAGYDGELYSSYVVVTPEKGRKTLTKGQIQAARDMCYAGATATIDIKLGIKLDKATKKGVEIFESSRENAKSLLD